MLLQRKVITVLFIKMKYAVKMYNTLRKEPTVAGFPKSLCRMTAATKLKEGCSLKEKL